MIAPVSFADLRGGAKALRGLLVKSESAIGLRGTVALDISISQQLRRDHALKAKIRDKSKKMKLSNISHFQ